MDVGLLMIAGGVAAGIFGSLLGLGGGILIVPLLGLGFGLPLREAVGVSLICVIVTSNASAGTYLQRHTANLRLGMSLELFTAVGALAGASVAFVLSERVLAALFAALLVYVAVAMVRRRESRPAPVPSMPVEASPSPPVAGGRWDGLLADVSGPGYHVRRPVLGIVGATFAGVVSALLGVGGGIIKVPLMNVGMGVPLRVAAATSNLMIGITASAGAILYLLRGEIDPYVAGPTALGVFLGATLGSRTAHRIDVRYLRLAFVVVLIYTAIQMALRVVR